MFKFCDYQKASGEASPIEMLTVELRVCAPNTVYASTSWTIL